MGERAQAVPATGTWCRLCKEPVRLEGPGWLAELRKAVHAATGEETGPGYGEDGWHVAAPTTEDPVKRALADEVEAEYPELKVSVLFGFFRADWRDLPPGVTAAHYEADTADELRARIRGAAGLRRDLR